MRIPTLLILAAAATAALTPASAPAQTSLLGELLRIAGGNKSTSSGSAAAARGSTAGGGTYSAVMTPAQSTGLQATLAARIENPAIARDVAEARPLIEKLVTIGACATSRAAWNAINAESLTPRTYEDYSWQSTVGNSKYHDKRSCFDVQRVGEWQKAARNALAFNSYYVSSLSGEAALNRFELIKTPEGQWLVRTVNRE